MTTVIQTKRLRLREFEPRDEEVLQRILSDPETMATLGGARGAGAAVEYIERSQRAYEELGYGIWATMLKADGMLVGMCGLLRQRVEGQQEVEIGYTIAKAHWGQGLATEAARGIKAYAFEKLGLGRVISLITEDNVASQAVALKNGLVYERDVLFRDQKVRLYVAGI